MKTSTLFREAAKRIYSGRSAYSCLALDAAGANVALVNKYSHIIAPEGVHDVLITDFERDDDGEPVDSVASREHRVIALLMAGQAVEDFEEV